MNTGFGNRQEYAISTWTYENETIESAICSIKKHGFSELELWADKVHGDPRLNSLSHIQRLLRDNSIGVHSIHAPFSGIGDNGFDDAFFRNWETLLIKTAQYSSELNSGMMVVHILNRSFYNVFAGDLGRISDFIGNICLRAKTYGVKILLENLVGSGAPGEFACTISELKRVFGSLDIGYCIDISHTVLTGQDLVNEIKTAGEKLMSVHVSNTDGIHDIHSLPQDGVIRWAEANRLFRQGGFSGKFVLEINGRESPERIMDELVHSLFS